MLRVLLFFFPESRVGVRKWKKNVLANFWENVVFFFFFRFRGQSTLRCNCVIFYTPRDDKYISPHTECKLVFFAPLRTHPTKTLLGSCVRSGAKKHNKKMNGTITTSLRILYYMLYVIYSICFPVFL